MPKQTILIADDDIALLKMLRTKLAAVGYKVHTARDGYQALAFAVEHSPDLMILDINMPAGDGISVAARLDKIADFSAIPIIYITGEEKWRIRDATREFAVSAILHKPFEDAELFGAVTHALGEHAATLEESKNSPA